MSLDLNQKILDEIYNEIEAKNTEYNPASVVHSDEFIKMFCTNMGIDKDAARSALRILNDAHKLLHIEITHEDEAHNIERVDGYVVADLTIIRNLTTVFNDLLVNIYEKQYKKRMGAATIIKEIFPMMQSLNNTEIGQVANKAIILHEYENMLEKDWKEYSIKYQEQKMVDICSDMGIKYEPKVEGVEPAKNRESDIEEEISTENFVESTKVSERAIDTPGYIDYSNKKGKYPLERILKIYGADFFFRTNLRKYDFKYLRMVIDDGQIKRRNDLKILKQYLKKVKDNMYSDPNLEKYRDDVYELEKAVNHAIYFTSSFR